MSEAPCLHGNGLHKIFFFLFSFFRFLSLGMWKGGGGAQEEQQAGGKVSLSQKHCVKKSEHHARTMEQRTQRVSRCSDLLAHIKAR